MNKSQLRLLAAEVADGRIPPGEYRARRRELIDNIVAGTQTIERAEPRTFDNGDDDVTTINSERAEGVRAAMQGSRFPVPIPVLLAGGSALCIVIVIALLWPSDDAPVVTATSAPSAPLADEVPRTRALVESFVARRDFDPLAINAFKREWQQFGAQEQKQARSEFWFGALVRALSDEIKTQKALAGLSDGDKALNRARTALEMGEFLGIADKLPGVDDMVSAVPLPPSAASPAPPNDGAASTTPAEPAPAAATLAADEGATVGGGATATPPVVETAAAAAPSMPQQPSTPPAQSAASEAPAVRTTRTASAPTGRQWLAAQADDHLTLQIFAVNKLDRVEQLIGAHPDLEVHVLATEGAVPRYRIFHGVFTSEQSATDAFAKLPGEITEASHGAIVKSFSVVRDDLRGLAPVAASASTDSDSFTVQVFATDNRDSAQALIGAFPALKLQLREIRADATPYRVVWGEFGSADEARNAAASLPQPLLARIGTPLPKPLSALGDAARP